MSLVYFDASTGQVSSLDAGFRTFRGETDAATIPMAPTPSGRTALVPGFFAGARAAHERFGRLPWADLLAPAIWIAEGMPLGASLAGMLQMREEVLSRTPEGRAALLPGGAVPREGEVLVQAELARTLRVVAEQGAGYLYTGEWARKFVDVVRREGGKVTLEDLASYRPIWSDPVVGSAYGYDLYGVGLPNTGGACLIEGVKLAAELGVGDPQTDPAALHLLVQIARTNMAFTTAVEPSVRVTDEHVGQLAKAIQETGRAVLPSAMSTGSHSDFVLAADEQGNMVAVCHTINTGAFGSTGIFVDGISIPDAASFQQIVLTNITPGDPLPNPMNPTIVLKDGQPVLASSSIGAGLQETTLTCVHRHLAHGVSVADTVRGVLIHGPDYGVPVSDSINNDITDEIAAAQGDSADDADNPTPADAGLKALMAGGDDPLGLMVFERPMGQTVTGPLSPEFLSVTEEHGTLIIHKTDDQAAFARGYWGAIARDPHTGTLTGARTAFLNTNVEGI